MSTKPFQFKRFTIHQDKCAMKIGTDGVLLPCWIPKNIISKSKEILDIGTGTGLIALILAQRTNNNPTINIEALEIDEQAAYQAKENFDKSIWHNQLKVINKSLNDYYSPKKYDLIVSNPPYFENSLKSEKNNKNLARHTDSLSFEQLISKSSELQLNNGYLALVTPFTSNEKIISIALKNNYQLINHCKVKPKPEKTPKRSLLLFQKTNSDTTKVITELIIEDKGRHQYSDEYINLTKEFYLKM